MRWQGQQLDVIDDDALPGMESIAGVKALDGLVRTVTTPEFAGVTFHEVHAKSALNHVPGPSAMPFAWTVNPYRGCTHACVYCVSPDTLVLMADGRHKPIRDVLVGDDIVGTERTGAYRRYVRTTVEAKWPSRKRAHRITLADGTEIIASGDHRFLSGRGWKHVTGATSGAARRPFLTINDRLMGFGHAGVAAESFDLHFRLEGMAVKTVADLRILRIEDLGHEVEMVDITTGTGDFIANGVISHNCFARRTHEYLDFDAGRDFDEQIVVKTNVAEVLRRELARPSWKHEHVALGTNTDPYQRAEGRYRLMPGIISALATSGTPFSVLTKGTLLRRDLPLLAEAASAVRVDLSMSIAVVDAELRATLEPGAPSFRARLATVRAASEAGFRPTVFLMPVLPHLTDDVATIDHALSELKDAGARRVIFGALHLRPGAKQWFWQWLESARPDLLPLYRGLYPGASVNAPVGYRRMLSARVRPLLRRHGLAGGLEDEAPTSRARPGPVITTTRGRQADEPATLF